MTVGGRLARLVALGSLFCLVGIAREARAGAPAASFALIIGSNVSVDADVPPLKYADDDAANYQDLFRLLGARTMLLSRLDENTRRLHPQAAAEALEPKAAALERAVAQLVADVQQARDRGVETVLYFVYAGHGNVQNGQGYISLEDARITGGDLARIVASIPATRVHVIADACASYYLAYSRGPGGERRPIGGFEQASELAADPRVGLLLSTSSARESHEWEGFQGGVFSQEVRSGLYGAADADGDGQVSYREIAAFVSRANAAIPNERFRPNVHARPPRDSTVLLDLRRSLGRRLEIDGKHAAHYRVEDALGVRLLDVHNGDDQNVHIVRPPPTGPVYVRRMSDDVEFTLPSAPDALVLGDLTPASPREASRGAAHEAYNLVFSLPFGQAAVDEYAEPTGAEPWGERPTAPASSRSWRTIVGWSAVGAGAAGLAVGIGLSAAAITTTHGASPEESGASVAQRNARVAALNAGAAASYVAGGVVVTTGLVMLLWPWGGRHVQAVAAPSASYLGVFDSF